MSVATESTTTSNAEPYSLPVADQSDGPTTTATTVLGPTLVPVQASGSSPPVQNARTVGSDWKAAWPLRRPRLKLRLPRRPRPARAAVAALRRAQQAASVAVRAPGYAHTWVKACLSWAQQSDLDNPGTRLVAEATMADATVRTTVPLHLRTRLPGAWPGTFNPDGQPVAVVAPL